MSTIFIKKIQLPHTRGGCQTLHVGQEWTHCTFYSTPPSSLSPVTSIPPQQALRGGHELRLFGVRSRVVVVPVSEKYVARELHRVDFRCIGRGHSKDCLHHCSTQLHTWYQRQETSKPQDGDTWHLQVSSTSRSRRCQQRRSMQEWGYSSDDAPFFAF